MLSQEQRSWMPPVSSSDVAPAGGTVLGAEAPPGLLAIEDVKPDEQCQESDQIRIAVNQLPEQLEQNAESQLADWVHSALDYPTNLWMSSEYAFFGV